ncbi:uncharacterized protein BJ212DRAFT_1539955 [Suillus subaureus]|uniref:Uncharacterized protein n=1 Tax=Suillus subaureus TaxID=48587 RepID=A0A9P7EIJ4_9AGAM|nr:uncharacterized protein BJ212DRAFT_1539955 [Suillus subaureus]KAG1822530.1 hypothetical protein BJ212DRAFT_1539955 [Suillus subaureus]
MAASSKPTDESFHPYDALPNHQDFDRMISNAVDTRTDFYDPGLTSRRYALVGVACSTIFSCSCIVAGIITLADYGVLGVTNVFVTSTTDYVAYPIQMPLQGELLVLVLNLIITLCTESLGSIHGISLRSALASESRLRFNTNLRLLTATRGWYKPNGTLLNGIWAVLLIICYSSTSFIACPSFQTTLQTVDKGVAFAGLPVLVLGVALLLQVMIALLGMRCVKILTWSSSPFDLTAALLHHTQLTPTTLRCMRSVSNPDKYGGPAKPSKIQSSAWHAHPSVQKVVVFLWVIVAACAGWAALVMYIWDKLQHSDTQIMNAFGSALTLQTWSFFPNEQSSYIRYMSSGIFLFSWVNMAIIQAPLTLGLHCSELIANVIRDERQWRFATGRKGLQTVTNPMKAIFTHPICLILFVAKPFLHWIFGLAFNLSATAVDGRLMIFMASMYTGQIWNLCIALFIFSCFFTFVALRRPRGPQPAAYGHLQTLANLVDEWSPVMWWGHKEDGIPYCHAGTSDHPLSDVKMDCVYAGCGAGSLVPLS